MQHIIEITDGVPRHPLYRMNHPVNLAIASGEQVAIVGANGSGKSRLVDIITGRYPLLLNEVRYDFSPSPLKLVSENIKYITFRDSYGDSDGSYYYQQRWNQHDIDEKTPTAGQMLEEAFTAAENTTGYGMDEEGKLLLDIPLGRALVERLSKEKTATVLSAETKRKRVYPPKVYSLADIQTEANRLYGFTAEETLAGCQALYEKHKVTSYPRTDSAYLPESQHDEAPGVLAAIAKTFPATAKAVAKADPALKSPVFNDKKVTAHHGIVPVAHAVDWTQLSEREQKLYRLIAKRYIAQFFPVHEYDETVVKLALGDEVFTARGRVVAVKGWKALYQKVEKNLPEKRPTKKRRSDDAETEDEDASQTLPPLRKGDVVDVLSVDGREDQTKPPAYFTEGTLIAAMETIWKSFDDPHLQEKLKEAGGIGTPATRSVIIQELKRKKYLETEGKKLHCTEEGRKVLLTASPKVRSAVMTAQFEAKLQEIERGTTTLDAFVAEYEAFIRAELAEVTAKREGGKTAPKTLGAQGSVSEASVG